MQFPEVAGFDPIFWLHHANVDRLVAMWQALNPDSFIVPTVNAYGSYYEPVGSVDSGMTGQCYTWCAGGKTDMQQLWRRFIPMMAIPCSPPMESVASNPLATAIRSSQTGR